ELLGSASDLGVETPTPDDVLDAAETAIPGRWLVEVEGEPVLRGGSASSNSRAQETVHQRAAEAEIPMEVQEHFVSGWNGMSVQMADTDVAKLRDLPGVTAVYPVLEVEMPEPQDATPEDVYGNAMTGVAQDQQGDAGHGVVGAGLRGGGCAGVRA